MWTKDRQKEMQPFVIKLTKDLAKEDITLQLEDDNTSLNNIIATKGDKSIKMSHHSFYRYSGTGQKIIGSGKETKLAILTLREWMGIIIKSIIIRRLSTPKSK